MTKSEDVRLSFKHYSKLTCENQEKEIFFSDLLARVLEIWQDGTVKKDKEEFGYAFTFGNCKKLYRSRDP